MVTTAQARVHGVPRTNLAHRVRTGELERTDQYGVYRLAVAPTSPPDDLRATWLSTNPEVLAPERTCVPRPDAVIASAAAATVHGIGYVCPAPHLFIVPGRRQSTRSSLAYSWRPLDARDIEVVDGLPTTTRERTIVDLLEDEGDHSIVADALRDAMRGEYDLDATRLEELLAPYASRLGQPAHDGSGALTYLMVTAGMDAASEAGRAVDRILRSATPAPAIEMLLIRLVESHSAWAASVSGTAPHLADVVASLRKSSPVNQQLQ